jgi:hypothetical protein
MTDKLSILVTERQFASWLGIAVLAETLGTKGWALAGGQMVSLHLHQAELPFPRVTIDADTIVDVRARPEGAQRASEALIGAGWEPQGVDNIVHRFRSALGGVVDILGPDGLRTKPITVPPSTTLLAPGGTQLLRRSSPICLTVTHGDQSIEDLLVPLPSRLSALIGKSAALGLPEGRDRHLLDAIHLSACLRPDDLNEALTKSDKRWLRNFSNQATPQSIRAIAEPTVSALAVAVIERLKLVV